MTVSDWRADQPTLRPMRIWLRVLGVATGVIAALHRRLAHGRVNATV
jgi:hypothetical protein